ncbi:thiamine-phosphate kinase [Halobacillus litoralis]|uniref:thiamine-phosphate kinase n=1 Tax=Halobacillus litoralis TaxID=45668 RepID=UPI001CD265CD|nr:thiamine-phosphate kinase [Halobacillus litoralis]MCA0970418.1 thiamine-phosphate kinase [Halobacillus litoralis]
MDEFSFIRSIRPNTYRQPTLIKGIDDDAAVFRPMGQDVVTAVDTMVEGVHFSKETMEAADVGYRALAANLSDLAAMGSRPAFYLVSLVVPDDWSQEELDQLYKGMGELADSYHMDLIGGDTVGGQELCVSVTVFGYVTKDMARYRSAAVPGDVVFVTGSLGDSRAGLACLFDQKEETEDSLYLIGRHRRPSPRVAFADAIGACERVALNDVSDGIANEANEIAESSDVDLVLDVDALPFSKAIQALYPEKMKEWMLSGGEDFELIGTVSESEWAVVQEAASQTGVPITRIGKVTEKKKNHPSVYIVEEGVQKLLEKTGYTHMKRG